MYAISTNAAPKSFGPFSQGTSAARFVFISAQQPIDPATGAPVEGGVEAQTKQCLKNVSGVLANLELTLADVTKVTILLTDISQMEAVYETCDEVFDVPRPACTVAGVSALPNDAQITIEAIACR